MGANEQGSTANIPGSSPYCSSTDYGLLESSLLVLVNRAENAAIAAEASAAAALASEQAAAASAQAAADSAAAALVSETNADLSATEAYNWAQYPIDTPVPEGNGVEFSSYHWAQSAQDASGKYSYSGKVSLAADGQLQPDYQIYLQSYILNSTGGEVAPNALLFWSGALDMVTIRLVGDDDTNFVNIPTSDISGGCILNGYMRLKKDKFIEFQFFSQLDRWIEVARS